MTDAEVKKLMREKGACGEVFTDERGVKVTCLLTCENHHREVMKLRRVAELVREMVKTSMLLSFERRVVLTSKLQPLLDALADFDTK